jgi:hypothetical protein
MRARHASASAWLHLAATPAFVVMALVTATAPATGMDMLCSPMHGTAALGSMTMMYLLMSALHAGPWLQMLPAWRRRTEDFNPTNLRPSRESGDARAGESGA